MTEYDDIEVPDAIPDAARLLAFSFAPLTAKEMLFVHGVFKGLTLSSAAAYAHVRVQSAARFALSLARRHPAFAFLAGCKQENKAHKVSRKRSANKAP